MSLSISPKLSTVLSALLLAQLVIPSTVYLKTITIKQSRYFRSPLALQQSANLKLLDLNNDPNPVVNEGKQLQLKVVDSKGQEIRDAAFESGSPEIARVDPQTGMVTGVEQGFATITGRRGGETVSNFVVVSRVGSGKGMKIGGQTQVDAGGAIYFSDPNRHVIIKKMGFGSEPDLFAGRSGVRGMENGLRLQSLFAGPLGVAVDNRAKGGLYITDTLNHSIRKIGFNDKDSKQVATVLGNGMPGMNRDDVVPFEGAAFSSPQGVAVDSGGNLYIADTDNHAVYVADFQKREVRLIAGEPGMGGKADGIKRSARFNRPTAIYVKSSNSFFGNGEEKTILVADTGNNVVRTIDPNGKVDTLGAIPKLPNEAQPIWPDADGNEFQFEGLKSISADGAGNIYVVDSQGVKVITQPAGRMRQVVSLAQKGASFGQAVSAVVQGSTTFVLDAAARSEADAVKAVTVGAPKITTLNQRSALIQTEGGLEGGAEIILSGRNFAPETQVTLGNGVVQDTEVMSATEIRFRVPPQKAPGNRTLSIRTRGGIAQVNFSVFAKPLSEIAAGEITTIAGGIPFLGDGGSATAMGARLNFAAAGGGAAVDAKGNLFIADSRNNRVRRVDAESGIITTAAGNGAAGFDGDDRPALEASLNKPSAVAIDEMGNLFIADSGNHRIRRIDANTDFITTIAGNGIEGFGGDDGLATAASLSEPGGIALDAIGNLLIADTSNNCVRRVEARTGIIATIAGIRKPIFFGDGGPASKAGLNGPRALALDGEGNIFIADSLNNRIRRIDARTMMISTAAGNGGTGFSGDGGPAAGASFRSPEGVAVDASGNLYIADTGNNRVRSVEAQTGMVFTIAGSGRGELSGDGGPAAGAGLNLPRAVSADGTGNLFITDNGNNRIRRMDLNAKTITTMVGANVEAGDGERAVRADLSSPSSIAADRMGNLYIADAENNRVRRVDVADGLITTIAGNGETGYNGDDQSAAGASLNGPKGVAVDGNGNVFIADTGNHRIRRVDASTGRIFTVAGTGRAGFDGDNARATERSLNNPSSVTVDGAGNLFIADTGNNIVRRVDSGSNIITIFAGNLNQGFSGDGAAAVNAALAIPSGVAMDKEGNLFIADSGNNRIRRVDMRTGKIGTAAGNGNGGFSGDGGSAATAALSRPQGVTIDAAGNLIIADSLNNRIRRVSGGAIFTIAGDGKRDYDGDEGPAAVAKLNAPLGVASDEDGNLLVADSSNGSIRAMKMSANAPARVVITNTSFSKPNLIINGMGFGLSGAQVMVNGQDISGFIVNQSDTAITLKGNKKKLNIKKGPNQVTVTVGGVTSNTFVISLIVAATKI